MTLGLPEGSNQAAKGKSNIYAVIEGQTRRAADNCLRSKRIAEEIFNMKYGGGIGCYHILWDQYFRLPTA